MVTRRTASFTLVTSLLLPLAMLAPSIHAADIKERNIKLPVVTAIDHPLGVGTVKFAELLAKKSDGRFKAKVFPNGTLGGEVQVISAMQGGTIEASAVPL